MINNILNILFPEKCPVCGQRARNHYTVPICCDCWQKLLPYKGPKCMKCSRPLVSERAIICGDCLKDAPLYKHASSFGLYKGVLKTAINRMKYHGIKRLAKPLSELLFDLDFPNVDSVIPVPLYNKRLKQREFNQSALIANHAAKHLGKTLLLDCLLKIKDTSPQVGLPAKERIKNMKKAFEVRNQTLIHGKTILLIDDVFTTGATVRECARTLKKAGAGDIFVMTLAHGMMD